MEPQNKKDRVVHTMVVLDSQMESYRIGKIGRYLTILVLATSVSDLSK